MLLPFRVDLIAHYGGSAHVVYGNTVGVTVPNDLQLNFVGQREDRRNATPFLLSHPPF